MDATARFEELIQVGGEPPLDESGLLIAAHAHPELDVDEARGRFDDLARGCPAATLDDLRAYLFEELGFRGNTDDYADPENSYLDSVLDRRLGIPITLSVVAIEVGRRVGVRLGGVGMPGHFLVRSLDEPGLFLDPFHGGRALGEPECRALYHEVLGHATPFDPSYLEIVGSRTILWRMLSNLRQAFASRGVLRDLRWVLELQLAFPDIGADERRRVASMLGSVGRLDVAAEALDEAAEELGGETAEKMRRQAHTLRARLN